jgi:hypothetical protein
MDERSFHLRSRALHTGESNDLAQLDLEVEVEGSWQPIDLMSAMPPFRAFVCSALMCQHAYLRMNASERDLEIDVATSDFWMKTADWLVTDVTATFRVTVRNDDVSDEDLSFIGERMRDCPISRNLTGANKVTTVELDADD